MTQVRGGRSRGGTVASAVGCQDEHSRPTSAPVRPMQLTLSESRAKALIPVKGTSEQEPTFAWQCWSWCATVPPDSVSVTSAPPRLCPMNGAVSVRPEPRRLTWTSGR